MSSILVSKKSSSRVVSVRLPARLADDLDKLRADAKRVGLSVDISSTVADALSRAIRQARAELARHAGHDANGGQGNG
jgi:post-segregation antitoxin (ccd killing protein)